MEDEIVGSVDELLGAIATVAPSASPQLVKSQPLYAAGLSSMPAVAPQRIGGPDSILTMTAHVNTLPIQQAVNSPLYNPNAIAPSALAPYTPAAGYEYNWSDDGSMGPDLDDYSGDDEDVDDMMGAAKKAAPGKGHQAVATVKNKMASLKTRVARASSSHGAVLKGAALCGLLDDCVRGDLGNPVANVLNLPQPVAGPAAPIDMTAALNAINTAMGQLQAQYQQLLADDAAAQGAAQQFANMQDLPGQTGQTASFYTMLMNIDANLQQEAASVSQQIDALNSNLDNLNQQLSNLATQQQNYAQEVANVQAQQQVVNTPVTATPNFPGYVDPSQYQYQPPSLSYGVDGGSLDSGYGYDPFGDDSGSGDDMSDM